MALLKKILAVMLATTVYTHKNNAWLLSPRNPLDVPKSLLTGK